MNSTTINGATNGATNGIDRNQPHSSAPSTANDPEGLPQSLKHFNAQLAELAAELASFRATTAAMKATQKAMEATQKEAEASQKAMKATQKETEATLSAMVQAVADFKQEADDELRNVCEVLADLDKEIKAVRVERVEWARRQRQPQAGGARQTPDEQMGPSSSTSRPNKNGANRPPTLLTVSDSMPRLAPSVAGQSKANRQRAAGPTTLANPFANCRLRLVTNPIANSESMKGHLRLADKAAAPSTPAAAAPTTPIAMHPTATGGASVDDDGSRKRKAVALPVYPMQDDSDDEEIQIYVPAKQGSFIDGSQPIGVDLAGSSDGHVDDCLLRRIGATPISNEVAGSGGGQQGETPTTTDQTESENPEVTMDRGHQQPTASNSSSDQNQPSDHASTGAATSSQTQSGRKAGQTGGRQINRAKSIAPQSGPSRRHPSTSSADGGGHRSRLTLHEQYQQAERGELDVVLVGPSGRPLRRTPSREGREPATTPNATPPRRATPGKANMEAKKGNGK